jgi:beta-glucosidase
MKKFFILSSALLLVGVVAAQPKYQEINKGDFVEITQQGGRTLGYSQNSGVKILTIDGFAFKDLNRNGKLDKYEDWRLTSEERAKDLASQLSLEEIAGLMLYSSHQALPAYKKSITYNGQPFSKSNAAPEDLTDQQLKFITHDKVRHILLTKVQSPYVAAKWNNKVKAGDTVYVLGDLFFRSANVEPILNRLNGRKHLLLGNHDHSWTGKVRLGDYFESVQTMKEIDVCGAPATLCHYPMLSYPQARRGYMIYGHIHNNTGDDYWPLIMRRPRMLNAGVDVNGYEPVTFEELVANNAKFRQCHAETAHSNPLAMFCAEA